ncbi:MAG: MFS transporter [Nocardioidaceae bacterium]
MSRVSSFAPLRERPFRIFYIGRSVSILGSSMSGVALAFAVLDLTGSAGDLGYVLAANSIPLVVFMLLGGVIADRFSRSVVLRVSHAGAAVTQGTVAGLLLTHHATLPALIVIEALNGFLLAFTFPALQGVVPLVVKRQHMQQANAMLAFSRSGAAIFGPTVSTLLVVSVGSGWAIAIDSASYAVAAVMMSILHLPASARAQATSMMHDLKEGWSEFTSRTWLWLIVVVFGVLNAIQSGVLSILGPTIARETIGKGPYGWVLSAEAAGFLVMTLVLMRVRLRFPLRAGMLGISMLGVVMIVLGADPRTLPLVALAAVGGAGAEVFSIGWQTAVMENIPVQMLSRVFSYDALGSFVAIPVGQLLVGPLASSFGARRVALVGGIAYIVLAVATVASRSVRNLQRGEQPDADEPQERSDAGPVRAG